MGWKKESEWKREKARRKEKALFIKYNLILCRLSTSFFFSHLKDVVSFISWCWGNSCKLMNLFSAFAFYGVGIFCFFSHSVTSKWEHAKERHLREYLWRNGRKKSLKKLFSSFFLSLGSTNAFYDTNNNNMSFHLSFNVAMCSSHHSTWKKYISTTTKLLEDWGTIGGWLDKGGRGRLKKV